MVSIIEIVLYTKPTAEHQYRVLPSSCHSLYTIPWEYDVYVPSTIQRIHTITYTHTSDSTTRIPLVVGYHPAIRSISSIFHKHIYILSSSQLGATLFKSIPLVTFLRTIAMWTSRSEPELSIHVMVLYAVQNPIFLSRTVENERDRRPSWPGLASTT